MGGGKARGAVSQGTALLGELRQVGPARRTAARGGAWRGAVGFHSGRNARKTARRDPLPLPSLAEVGFPPAIRKERTKVYHLAPLRRGTGGAGRRAARPSSFGRNGTHFLEGHLAPSSSSLRGESAVPRGGSEAVGPWMPSLLVPMGRHRRKLVTRGFLARPRIADCGRSSPGGGMTWSEGELCLLGNTRGNTLPRIVNDEMGPERWWCK